MITLKKLCRNCGTPFDSTRSNQKYCCYECKMEAAYREQRLAARKEKDNVAISDDTVIDSFASLNRLLRKHGYRMSVATLYSALRYSDRTFRDEYGVYNIPAVLQFAKEHFARFKVRTDDDTGSKGEEQNQEHIEEV
jgi:hypothetical protein